jgi:hypothetical protein
MTLVMLATVPFLAGMGFAISIFMGRNTTKINAAYAGGCVGGGGCCLLIGWVGVHGRRVRVGGW